MIGPSTTVLLTSGDEDNVDPPVDAAADYASTSSTATAT